MTTPTTNTNTTNRDVITTNREAIATLAATLSTLKSSKALPIKDTCIESPLKEIHRLAERYLSANTDMRRKTFASQLRTAIKNYLDFVGLDTSYTEAVISTVAAKRQWTKTGAASGTPYKASAASWQSFVKTMVFLTNNAIVNGRWIDPAPKSAANKGSRKDTPVQSVESAIGKMDAQELEHILSLLNKKRTEYKAS